MSSDLDAVWTVFDGADALLIALDGSGRVLRFNRAFSEATGYHLDDARGMPGWELCSDASTTAFWRGEFDRLRRAERWPPRPVTCGTGHGAKRRILWSRPRVFGQEGAGNVVLLMGLELPTEQDEDAPLLGMVAHDLRNSVQLGLVAAEALARETDRREEREGQKPASGVGTTRDRLSAVRVALHQAMRLARDLGDRTSIESGRFRLERKRFAPGAVLSEAAAAFAAAAESKSLRLECRLPTDLPSVHADRARLFQVLSNLLGNAIKFSPPGGRVLLTAHAEDDAVRVTVADSGPGVDDADAEQLFLPYWHADARHGGGTGLGLTIAKAIIEAHGGRIGVGRRRDGGTAFSFTLPIGGEAAE